MSKPEPMVGDSVMLTDSAGSNDVCTVDRRLGRYFFVNGHKLHVADDRTSDRTWDNTEVEVALLSPEEARFYQGDVF